MSAAEAGETGGLALDEASMAQRIAALVRGRQPGARDVQVSGIKPMSGGNARRAWMFDAQWTDAAGPHSQPCVLLARLETGQVEADMGREFATLAALHPTGLPVPQALWLDEAGELLGMPGFAMARGEGSAGVTQLLKPGAPLTRPLTEQLMRIAARLHALDHRSLTPSLGARTSDGPRVLPSAVRPEPVEGLAQASTSSARTGSFLPTGDAADAPLQVLRQWEAQFHKQRMEPVAALASVFGWLHRNLPVPPQVAVVHGDLRLGNFLHAQGRITLLLDWEMSHLGDPLEDIAWAYRRLWSPQNYLPIEDAMQVYEEAGGPKRSARELAWYRIFSEAKFAVLSLTAIRSVMDGKTGNLRLAGRASKVNECLRLAHGWIDELEGTP